MHIANSTERKVIHNMNNSYSDAIPVSETYKSWGFHQSVFNADEARKEERLDKVLQLPSWFFEILGNVSDEDFLVVVGVRGAGKSALRRNIALHCESEIGSSILEGNVLCITIDHDNPNWVSYAFQSNSFYMAFCSELADRIALGILNRYTKVELHEKLDNIQLGLLERYINRLNLRKPEEAKSLLEKTRSKFKSALESEIFKNTVRIGTALVGSEIDISKNTSQDTEFIYKQAFDDLDDLISVSRICGYDSIYILVDELDEYNETVRKPKKSAELLAPIICSPSLLEKRGLTFKFFLSEPVYNELISLCEERETEIRWDRTTHTDPYFLRWSDKDIHEMLSKRLRAYSEGNIKNSMKDCCNEELYNNIDSEIIKYAYCSPRHFIQLCSKLAIHTARVGNKTSRRITKEVFQTALYEFATRVCKDLYGQKYVNTLIQLGLTRFTAEIAIEKLSIACDQVDEFIKIMVNSGGILKLEKIGVTEFIVQDPRVIFLMDSQS